MSIELTDSAVVVAEVVNNHSGGVRKRYGACDLVSREAFPLPHLNSWRGEKELGHSTIRTLYSRSCFHLGGVSFQKGKQLNGDSHCMLTGSQHKISYSALGSSFYLGGASFQKVNLPLHVIAVWPRKQFEVVYGNSYIPTSYSKMALQVATYRPIETTAYQ